MKRRDTHQMRRLYEQWQLSGLSLKTFSRQNQISSSTFSYWIRKFKQEKQEMGDGSQRFSRITLGQPTTLPDQQVHAVIRFPSGVSLELYYPAGTDFIKSVIN